jgi:hypothetical protein
MKYIITNKQYNLILESYLEENLLKVPELSFFANDWEILQVVLKRKGNPKYYIDGDLNLKDSDIESLGNLVRVEGDLELKSVKIKTFEDLVRVDGNLDLIGLDMKSFGSLKYVGGNVSLFLTSTDSVGDLEYVEGNLDLGHTQINSLGNLKYVGGDLDLVRTPLAWRTTKNEIKSKVKVGGNIHL